MAFYGQNVNLANRSITVQQVYGRSRLSVLVGRGQAFYAGMYQTVLNCTEPLGEVQCTDGVRQVGLSVLVGIKQGSGRKTARTVRIDQFSRSTAGVRQCTAGVRWVAGGQGTVPGHRWLAWRRGLSWPWYGVMRLREPHTGHDSQPETAR